MNNSFKNAKYIGNIYLAYSRVQTGLKNWQWQQKQWVGRQEREQPLDQTETASSEFEAPKTQLDKIRGRMNTFGLAVPVLRLVFKSDT